MWRAVPERRLVVARRAVAAVFLLNAVAYANLVPRLPTLQADLGLSNTALGTAVAAMPLGALVVGPAAGWLTGRVGSARLSVGSAVGFGVVLPVFALAPSWAVLAGAFLVYGALDATMDVSMNAHALEVQQAYRRSIISGLHGLWSVGAVVGGATGTAATAAGLGLGPHLAVAGAAIAAVALGLPRWLLPQAATPAGAPPSERPRPSPGARRRVLPRLAVLALVVVLAAVVEDAPASWGAVLLRTELGTSAAAAGAVFLGFQSAMTVGRLVGDRLVDRFGPVRVVRVGGLATAAGVAGGLAIGSPAALVAGFVVAGVGAAPLFPLVFAAGGKLAGAASDHGVAAVSWVSRLGFLVAPPLVGALGDATSLRLGLGVVPVAGLAVAGLAGSLSPRPAAARAAPAPRP